MSEHAAALAALRARYDADRAARQAAHPPAAPGVCRYCGRAWRPWPGSKLDGHARCLVSAETLSAVASCPAPHSAIAATLGVSVAVARAWGRRGGAL